MNEQELAQRLSEQLDQILLGETVDVSAAADELQIPLHLSQQLAAVDFPPSQAAETAFEGQLAGWFGPSAGATFPTAGLSKIGSVNYAIIALVGVGLGVTFLLGSLLWSGSNNEITPAATLPPTTQGKTPELPALGLPIQDEATAEPTIAPTGAPVEASPTPLATATPEARDSVGDTIQLAPTSPPNKSLSDSLPTATPTATNAVVSPTPDAGSGSNDQNSGERETGQDAPSREDAPSHEGTDTTGDQDRGHGNDPDGFDEDNPGKSSGLPDNGGGKPSPGDFSQGKSGGSSGQGGQGGSSSGHASDNGSDNSNDKGKGNGKNKGKGKGK